MAHSLFLITASLIVRQQRKSVIDYDDESLRVLKIDLGLG